jgi:trk system potassium uptake protein TrkA
MRHSDFAEPLRLAGATHIISTIDLAVSTMVNAIEYPQVESMMHLEQEQLEVLKLSIPKNCYIADRTVAEIARDPKFPTGTLIIGYQLHPQKQSIVPNGSTILESGATVLILTKPALIHQIIDFMEGCP